MQTFTGWQYLLIDAANQFGLDKLLFEERIDWATSNLKELEALADQAPKKTKPLYLKAVKAIRKAQAGIPTGHLVGFDASCSGIQVMSAVTGCYAGAEATGLVNPDVRADAYTSATKVMNELLGNIGITIPRDNAKTALMTAFYGSKEQPKIIFGEGTEELDAFYKAAKIVAPGAWGLLEDLLKSWRPGALSHEWQLPDGYEAKVKVMVPNEIRIEVDELAHSTFTYKYFINQGTDKGLSNAANVVHSIDAYVLRSIHRRCNYDREVAEKAMYFIQTELDDRKAGWGAGRDEAKGKFKYYRDLYNRHQIADVVILPYIDGDNVTSLSTKHLHDLETIVETMLEHRPFEVVAIHDEFKCHPNNMNDLRKHYINIFCDLADSTILDSIFEDLYGVPVKYTKLSGDLSHFIANSNYALT